MVSVHRQPVCSRHSHVQQRRCYCIEEYKRLQPVGGGGVDSGGRPNTVGFLPPPPSGLGMDHRAIVWYVQSLALLGRDRQRGRRGRGGGRGRRLINAKDWSKRDREAMMARTQGGSRSEGGDRNRRCPALRQGRDDTGGRRDGTLLPHFFELYRPKSTPRPSVHPQPLIVSLPLVPILTIYCLDAHHRPPPLPLSRRNAPQKRRTLGGGGRKPTVFGRPPLSTPPPPTG